MARKKILWLPFTVFHRGLEDPAVMPPPAWRNHGLKRGLFVPAVLLAWMGVTHSLLGQGSTLVVTNLADGGAGSLRQQIAIAQPGDRISFAAGGTILLTNGALWINKSLAILGPGATNLTISAGSQSRVLTILPGARLILSGVTICDGRAADGDAGRMPALPGLRSWSQCALKKRRGFP